MILAPENAFLYVPPSLTGTKATAVGQHGFTNYSARSVRTHCGYCSQYKVSYPVSKTDKICILVKYSRRTSGKGGKYRRRLCGSWPTSPRHASSVPKRTRSHNSTITAPRTPRNLPGCVLHAGKLYAGQQRQGGHLDGQGGGQQ